MWGFVTAPAQFSLFKPPQTNLYTKCLIFEFWAGHYERSLPPAEEFPNSRSSGSVEYPLGSQPVCTALYCRLIPHVRLSPARNPLYLRLRCWLYSPGVASSHIIHQDMYLVHHRGASGFYLLGCGTWRECQVSLDSDPPWCPATKALS